MSWKKHMNWRRLEGYYVYIYLDSENNPYYVGMGKNKRLTEKHLYVDVPVLSQIIVEENMTIEQAWEREITLISQYGMKCENKGPLLNLASGGKTSNSGWHHSPEIKQQISKSLTGVKKKTTVNYRKPKSKEHCEAIRQANLGRPDDGRYEKIGLTKSKHKWYYKDEKTIMCEPGNQPEGYVPGRGKMIKNKYT